MATHSSTLPWEIPWTEEPIAHGVTEDLATKTTLSALQGFAKSRLTLCNSMDCQASLSITISGSVLRFMPIESVMPSNHLILCHPLLLLPSVFPSIRVLSNESALCTRWPKYWSFSISPSKKYSRLISYRTD